MRDKKQTIGFDCYIELEWLETTSMWVFQGKTRDELSENLDNYLASYIKGAVSLSKTKGILLGIWANPMLSNKPFTDMAIELYRDANKQERLVLHWGLAIARFPFFTAVIRQIGRLNRLQGSIHSSELVRRCIEEYGDREAIRRSATRVLKSLHEWGVLSQHERRVFHIDKNIEINNPKLLSWLIAALFFSGEERKISYSELMSDPIWFPFKMDSSVVQLEESGLLTVAQHGIGDRLISRVL